jgi:hypothetical protein
MTVHPFNFAEIDEVWKTQIPPPSKQQAVPKRDEPWSACDAGKPLLPQSFASEKPENTLLFKGATEHFANLQSSDHTQIGLFVTIAALIVFVLDQFTKMGIYLRS